MKIRTKILVGSLAYTVDPLNKKLEMFLDASDPVQKALLIAMVRTMKVKAVADNPKTRVCKIVFPMTEDLADKLKEQSEPETNEAQ